MGPEAREPQEAPFPKRIEFLRPDKVDNVPKDFRGLSEIKWNGIRAGAFVQDGKVRILTRGQKTATGFHWLEEGLGQIGHTVLLDGEIISGVGKTRRDRTFVIGQQFTRPWRPVKDEGFSYVVFDITYLDGRNLRNLPIEERKRILASIIPSSLQVERRIYVNHFEEEDHESLKEAAQKDGFEGIVLKEAESEYKRYKTLTGSRPPWKKIVFVTERIRRRRAT